MSAHRVCSALLSAGVVFARAKQGAFSRNIALRLSMEDSRQAGAVL
jgi:hypothetical protein